MSMTKQKGRPPKKPRPRPTKPVKWAFPLGIIGLLAALLGRERWVTIPWKR